MHVERKFTVVLIVVVAAVVAVVLLGLILMFSRSRFADESERFRYVSDLTSQWSRQWSRERQEVPVPAAPSTAASSVTAPAAGSTLAGEAGRGAIDLRDVADVPVGTADQTAPRQRR